MTSRRCRHCGQPVIRDLFGFWHTMQVGSAVDEPWNCHGNAGRWHEINQEDEETP